MIKAFFLSLFGVFFLSSCDANNFNSIFETAERRESIRNLILEAQSYLDQSKFDLALKSAEKARTISPESEQANVLTGYIYLGMAGMDTFAIAKNLSRQSTLPPDEAGQDETARTLGLLAEAMGLTLQDQEQMTKDILEGEPRIFIPKLASEARLSDSNIIKNLNLAITYLCPFVSDSAKLLDTDTTIYDDRHLNCSPYEGPKSFYAQAHFAWALAHLGEAVTFYRLIFFRDEDQSDANLIVRSKSLANVKDDPISYANEISSFASVIEQILPTDATSADDTVLNAIFDDLETTNLAFAAVAGMPESFTKSISKAIDNVKSKIGNISQASFTDKNQAMKNSLTKKLSKEIATQINDINASDEDKQTMCCAYYRINSEQNPPEGCPSKETLQTSCNDL